MIDNFLGLTTGFSIVDIGVLAALVTIIVEVLKSVFPKEFPTQILATCTSLIVSLTLCVGFYKVSVTTIFLGLILGFIVAFVSMKGFDALKEVLTRFTLYNYDKIDDEKKENITKKQEVKNKNVRK